MKIIDITPKTESQFFCCLEEWSEDMKDAGNQKQRWYDRMKEKGLRVKFAVDDNGINDALFINGKELFLGPPLSYEKIRKKIRKRVNRISHPQ